MWWKSLNEKSPGLGIVTTIQFRKNWLELTVDTIDSIDITTSRTHQSTASLNPYASPHGIHPVLGMYCRPPQRQSTTPYNHSGNPRPRSFTAGLEWVTLVPSRYNAWTKPPWIADRIEASKKSSRSPNKPRDEEKNCTAVYKNQRALCHSRADLFVINDLKNSINDQKMFFTSSQDVMPTV